MTYSCRDPPLLSNARAPFLRSSRSRVRAPRSSPRAGFWTSSRTANGVALRGRRCDELRAHALVPVDAQIVKSPVRLVRSDDEPDCCSGPNPLAPIAEIAHAWHQDLHEPGPIPLLPIQFAGSVRPRRNVWKRPATAERRRALVLATRDQPRPPHPQIRPQNRRRQRSAIRDTASRLSRASRPAARSGR
jgi:hypothetical protein